jgi:hypothetical protein
LHLLNIGNIRSIDRRKQRLSFLEFWQLFFSHNDFTMYKQKAVRVSATSLSSSFVIGTAVTIASTIGIALNTTLPATAQQACVPLRAVEGNGETTVRKRISSPGVVPGVNNNWNTDFAVPTGRRFTSYIATITPENAAAYNVGVNLKYNNNTSREVYRQDRIELSRNVPYQIRANTPPGTTRQPYQVNLNVSGTFGNTYQARVFACQTR